MLTRGKYMEVSFFYYLDPNNAEKDQEEKVQEKHM